ncbi:Trihelix transcription factor ASIL2 [Vitis vinifera]|uniref:Trihelix transcription factor ASIL2 n=1 Tax=Vitis vinifera TaxID=29760 RepID=A0A438GBQ5_VITVI|nr:Trihelix transcription factor ASIL2 [Vitis vinifera]
MNDGTGTPSPATAPPRSLQPLACREDCWTEDATHTLIEAWGDRYLELNRGNLRQKHWQEVADAVNALHGHLKKARRTDVQCKNRIDTLKKKYKIEKSRVSDSNGALTSQWPFYERLDALIGSNMPAKKPSPPVYRKTPPMLPPVPVGPRSVMHKRPAPVTADESFRRNFSVVAAAAAAVEEVEEAASARSESDGDGGREGVKELAQAIVRFGEIYEKVEESKQKQMIDLEVKRMQFARDLEIQRMKLFMDTQVQLEKIKHAKRSSGNGEMLF